MGLESKIEDASVTTNHNSLLSYASRIAKIAAVTGLVSLVYLTSACAQPEPVNSPVINPPTQTENYTTSEPPETAEPIVTVKPFELVGDNLTAEQYKTFSKNALEDYLKVLDVYGIREEDARMVVSINPKDYAGIGGFEVGFFYKGSEGGAGGPLYSLTTDRRQFRHEVGHAINDSMFGKGKTPHWLDEGLAIYTAFNGDLGEMKGYYRLKDGNYKWEDALENNPGYVIGPLFLGGLIEDYDLTLEKNIVVLKILAEKYSKTREQLTREEIQGAYEEGLNLDKGGLDPLFDLLRPGVMLLYSTDPKKVGASLEDYKKIRSEFSN